MDVSTVSPNGTSPPLAAWEQRHSEQYVDSIRQADVGWNSNLPYGHSPPSRHGGIGSVVGSPPLYQPSFEELRGGFSNASPPVSPRAAYRQPVRKISDYQSFGEYLGTSPDNNRPPSMSSQRSTRPLPPHHPQAHYYAAPEIDFGIPKPLGKQQASDRYCFILDSLPSAGDPATGNSETVLLVGQEHALNIYQVEKKKFERKGRLDGLRGAVIGAKILPIQLRLGHQFVQTLVVVIVHGPCLPSSDNDLGEALDPTDAEFDASKSMLQAMQQTEGSWFQTTVEVYSLKKAEHVATLFRSPKVEATAFGHVPRVKPPDPIGDLAIHAAGKRIVISSGSSGEAFIFEATPNATDIVTTCFKCIGKTWTRTSIANAKIMSINPTESNPQEVRETAPKNIEAALLSLGPRWLVFLPPPSSAQSTLHGQIPTNDSNVKIPGLNSHTAPTEPQIICNLDTPEDTSVLNRMAKDVAQGALKSAQWVATEGIQALQNYWNRSPVSSQLVVGASPPHHDFAAPLPPSPSFPPTHAQDDTKASKKQSVLISILDLEVLSKSQHLKHTVALHPVSTFSLPSGCSALSLSPNGLHLLTANAKGDEQQIWDLMRIVHGEAGPVGDPYAASKRPTVRQIARYSRMTPARIVDVVWTQPRGERFAIVTESSVHIFDLPYSAFQWPPFRRTQRAMSASSKLDVSEKDSNEANRPQSMGSTLGSAFGMFASTTQSVLVSVRGRSSTPGTGFSGLNGLAMTAGLGAKGSKTVASGINRSVSAAASGTVNTLRHLGENRFALPPSTRPIHPGCARWLNGKDQGSIATVRDGAIQVRSIQQSRNPKVGKRRPSVIAGSPAYFSVPKESIAIQDLQSSPRQPSPALTVRGSFWPQHSSRPSSRKANSEIHPLSFAEIETNAPYQPFHTDRRVNLAVFNDDAIVNSNADEPWVFGGVIPTTQISIGSTIQDESGVEHVGPGNMENKIRIEGNVEDGRQVVMTTRFKKKRKGIGVEAEEDNSEIFEDDCEIVDHADQRV